MKESKEGNDVRKPRIERSRGRKERSIWMEGRKARMEVTKKEKEGS